MHLKDRRGMTAMVDTMIFIVVIGLAVTAMFAFTDEEPETNDASAISESIFTAKMRADDLIESESSELVGIPDLVAVYILTEKGEVMDYIEDILDSVTQREGSYLLDIEYRDRTVSVGAGKGEPVSSSVKEFTVTYGDSIRTSLSLY